ncbi:MAG: hypothetical protein WDZ57_04695 [Demequina sp.]
MTLTSVVRVCIDTPLPHLDRLFDYAVPPKWQADAQVGARARVRFAGRLVNAVIVETATHSDFEGTLTQVSSVAALPSYTPQALTLARAVAERYAGSLWDVLRLMAPPRVAAVERRDWGPPTVDTERYRQAGQQCDDTAREGGLSTWDVETAPRVVWTAPPEREVRTTVPARRLLAAPLAVAASDRTALVVVPDARAIAVLERTLSDLGLTRWTSRSGGDYTVLDHDDGASRRYSSYLAGMLGHVRLIIGTRPAVLHPAPTLGIVVVWDEASNTYEEPHAPYPHARTVAAMRVGLEGTGLLLASFAPSVDAAALVAHEWAHAAQATRDKFRQMAPAVEVLTDARRDMEGGSGWHWMPGSAWRSLVRAISHGPVAVVVPRVGYVHALACARCGTWAACRECGGTLRIPAPGADPECTACATTHEHWHCEECQSAVPKQVSQGVQRVTEQLRVMSRGWDVHVSTGATGPLPDFSVDAGMVIATPGALPAVEGGYTHVVVIGAQTPASGGLGAEMTALRWWLSVAALARARGGGGGVTLVGELPEAVQRALTTWTPWSMAVNEYSERAQLGLPPARRVLQVAAAGAALTAVVAAIEQGVTSGWWSAPTVIDSGDGVTVLTSRGDAGALTRHLRQRQREWSRTGEHEVRLRVDGPLHMAQ